MIDRVRSFLKGRRTSYTRTFSNPSGEDVLKDLAKFCRAHRSTFHEDARLHAVMEGRREVFLRIANHLQLSDEKLWELYGEK